MDVLLGLVVAAVLILVSAGKSTVTKSISNAFAFVKEVVSDAKQLQAERGIDPRITLMQAAYESNFGLSELSRYYKNLFGIKQSTAWKSAKKPVINLPTKEAQQDGSFQTMDQYFKVYATYKESMDDWADLLEAGYPVAYKAAQNGDFELFFRGLAAGRWGAYAGPSDGSYVLNTYAKEAMALLPSITSALTDLV